MASVQKCRAPDFYIVTWEDERALIERFWGTEENNFIWLCYWCPPLANVEENCLHIEHVISYRRSAHEPHEPNNLTGEQRDD